MAEREPKPRFQERKDRDDDEDEDDDRPRRRRREDDDEDDEGEGGRRSRPAKRNVVGGDRPPVLFLVGLVGGIALLLSCCGVSGWWTYSVMSGGGGFSFGSEVEITTAVRVPAFGPNSPPAVVWTAVGKANVPDSPNAYVMVFRCGGKTHTAPYPTPTKNMPVTMTTNLLDFRNLSGPIEMWVERRTNPNKDGTRVSNVYRVP